MGIEEAKTEVDRIMNLVDTDGNECIDYSEFVTASIDRKKFLNIKRLE
jgi:Ca2+-binding EF-hand superfamily protein